MNTYLIIGFSTPRKFSLISWLIRKIEKTEFSHVYFCIFSKSLDRYLIYHASGITVNFVGDINFYNQNKWLFEKYLIITPEQKVRFLQKAIDLSGKPYGIKQLLGLGLVRICYLFNKKIKNPFSDGNKTYICSELVADHLQDLGFEFEELDKITPKDVYEKLKEYSNGQIVQK